MSVARKILIVDDEEDIVNLTEKFLQLENYETLTCSSGSEALEIVEEKHEDIALVLLDIMMPNLNGYEVLQKIKSNEKFNHILVVLFTVKNFFKDIKKGKELGADGYLVKAISGNEIVNYIENLLKKKKKKKEETN
jgi:DNA-binding response OmpR family regulator